MKELAEKPIKYRDIKRLILRYIEEHELAVDSPIPSEREWSEMTGVSRLTVRRAITDLSYEGFLYGVHGKGTYVQRRTIHNNLFALTSCTQDIISQGKTPTRKVLTSSIIPATSELASKLKISLDSPVFSLKRLYLADGNPINLTQTNMVRDYIPGVEDYDYEKVSLYDVIEKKMNISLVHAERYIKACRAPSDVAALLEVEKDFPLLYFEGIVYAQIGHFVKAIENFHSYYRTDQYDFYISQVRL